MGFSIIWNLHSIGFPEIVNVLHGGLKGRKTVFRYQTSIHSVAKCIGSSEKILKKNGHDHTEPNLIRLYLLMTLMIFRFILVRYFIKDNLSFNNKKNKTMMS